MASPYVDVPCLNLRVDLFEITISESNTNITSMEIIISLKVTLQLQLNEIIELLNVYKRMIMINCTKLFIRSTVF